MILVTIFLHFHNLRQQKNYYSIIWRTLLSLTLVARIYFFTVLANFTTGLPAFTSIKLVKGKFWLNLSLKLYKQTHIGNQENISFSFPSDSCYILFIHFESWIPMSLFSERMITITCQMLNFYLFSLSLLFFITKAQYLIMFAW